MVELHREGSARSLRSRLVFVEKIKKSDKDEDNRREGETIVLPGYSSASKTTNNSSNLRVYFRLQESNFPVGLRELLPCGSLVVYAA